MLATDPNRLRFLGIDLHSRTRRRSVVVLNCVAYAAVMISAEFHAVPYPKSVMWLASAGLVFLSVFREGGPVKPFESRWAKRSTLRPQLMVKLDEACLKNFGARFSDLSLDQQEVVMGRVRRSAMGKFFETNPPIGAETLDERDLEARNRASYLSLRSLTLFLISEAIGFGNGTTRHQPDDLVAFMLEMGVWTIVGPKAVILWTEVDPHEFGELELVDDQA